MSNPPRIAAKPVMTPLETPRVTAPGLPHINQYSPAGKDSQYVNGAFYCGPAVVAMLARAHGKFGNMNDATLMSKLAKYLVTPQGTSSQGLLNMLERANLPVPGKEIMGSYDGSKMQRHLKAGNKLIAQVGVYDKATNTCSAHWVLIRRNTHDGNFVVSDPMWDKPYTVSPQQLQAAIKAAPPDGGVVLPVGKNPLKPEVPTPSAAGKPSAPQPPSVLEKNAFTTQTNGKHKVDDTFRTTRVGDSPVMRDNQERNRWLAAVTYRNEGDLMELPATRVTPEHLSAEEFAAKLLRRKAKKDPELPVLLKQLEQSPFPRDQKVWRLIQKADLKHPGGGSKTCTAEGGSNVD